MLIQLKKELDWLSKKQQITQTRIDNLFFTVEDIQLRHHRINNPSLPNPNLMFMLRPEIINLIFTFIDYSSFLQFRLVCQKTNNQILYLQSKKMEKIEQQIQDKQFEIKEIINSNPLIEENDPIFISYQVAIDQIKKITREDAITMQSYSTPPQIVEKIFNLLTTLLAQNYSESKSKWRYSLKLITYPSIYKQLTDFDILSITDQQLNLLQPINAIDEIQCYNFSPFVHIIYKYIFSIVKLRELPMYKTILQVVNLRQDINKLNVQIQKLQNMFKQPD